ncbi:hypothetical protein RNO26_20210 [Escherichia coli]|nr:hypothetical protein [Escherichia coli]
MRLNTTGIAARMMLSLDKKAIGEKLINGRQINPTPLQVRYPQGVRDVLGIMSEQYSFPYAGNAKREYCGVILRQKKLINGSVIYPALSLVPTLMNDEKRKWLTEYTTRQNATMSLRRVTLRPGLAGNLITGQILPVSLFNTSLLPW